MHNCTCTWLFKTASFCCIFTSTIKFLFLVEFIKLTQTPGLKYGQPLFSQINRFFRDSSEKTHSRKWFRPSEEALHEDTSLGPVATTTRPGDQQYIRKQTSSFLQFSLTAWWGDWPYNNHNHGRGESFGEMWGQTSPQLDPNRHTLSRSHHIVP